MRLLFIGDIVGTPGVRSSAGACAAASCVQERIDLVVANAENAAGGSGLYPGTTAGSFKAAGVDASRWAITFTRSRDIVPRARRRRADRQAGQFSGHRPREAIMYCHGAGPAKRWPCVRARAERSCGPSIALSCGRPVLADAPSDVKCILVDVHAEATADKYLLVHHLKGRVIGRPWHAHPRADGRRTNLSGGHGIRLRRRA